MSAAAQQSVRAVGVRAFGGPEQLAIVEVADPWPRAGWVVVDVAAATVNPTDLLLRSGAQAAAMSGLISTPRHP